MAIPMFIFTAQVMNHSTVSDRLFPFAHALVGGDSTVILLVIVPVVFPAMMIAGVDPVHFGVVVVLNMMIGLATPPVGVLLFIMSNALDIPVRSIIREIWPFLLIQVSVLLVLIVFPDPSLWLPRQIGYGG